MGWKKCNGGPANSAGQASRTCGTTRRPGAREAWQVFKARCWDGRKGKGTHGRGYIRLFRREGGKGYTCIL